MMIHWYVHATVPANSNSEVDVHGNVFGHVHTEVKVLGTHVERLSAGR